MSKKKSNNKKKKSVSAAQLKAIRLSYYLKSHSGFNKKKSSSELKTKKENLGKVFRGNTKYIDVETKLQRNYVVVDEHGDNVSVSKLKTIKVFDDNGRNADKALVEINFDRYGLKNRTGVDFQRFSINRMSGLKLSLSDKDVFPDDKELFKLGSHDLSRAIRHTSPKKKKGK